ncbi:ABC transporter permease [Plesiomonas shigelloides]|uniref:ABC transporter permease n=1 Tax=Plesiomonas shigelloides TaxID=703 RepID=UPI001483B5AD|nr:iron export ABC transporter permease subunit FetB [Plesiomonas shigelloides]
MDELFVSWTDVALGVLLLGIPLLLSRWLQLKLGKDIVKSSLRMIVQLALIGVYLEYLFKLNNLWVNAAWLLVMMSAAASNAIKRTPLPRKRLFLPVFAGISCGALLILGYLLVVILQPTPWFDARFAIPLAGMLLGNALTANYLVLDRFYRAVVNQQPMWMMDLSLGATPWEAALPYVRQAMRSAWSPTILSMATLGIVSLPGMMTGQILGGNSPLLAIKYQILVMLSLLACTTLSSTLMLMMSLRVTLTPLGVLDPELAKLYRE